MNKQYTLDIYDNWITSDKYVKLLGICIDHKLSFDEHVFSLCKKQVISLMTQKECLFTEDLQN